MEWVGVVGVVALALAVAVAGGVRVPGVGVARAVVSRLLCAAALAERCGDEPRLIAAYGDEVGRLARRHMPTLLFERGSRALPVDFRRCRDSGCGDGTPRGEVGETDAGLPVTAFVHVVDCRDGAAARSAPAATGGDDSGGRGFSGDDFSGDDSGGRGFSGDDSSGDDFGGRGFGGDSSDGNGLGEDGSGDGDTRVDCSGARAGNLYLQYWLYYADSATLRGVPVAAERGYHRDDWESAAIRIGPDGRVDERASSHHGYNHAASLANAGSDAGIAPLRAAAEALGARPRNGWGPETSLLIVSGGSHAGNARSSSAVDRIVRGRRVHLVPLEALAAGRDGAVRFAVTPPWRKRVWLDPEAPRTD